jgi:uncharacterized protein YjbI with pentapeptide repeats
MSDVGQGALDGDNPVNPYSLLEAVNSASDTVNTAWLIFLGVLSYLLITCAGVTHKDMLLNNEIPLPILQVKIDLARFFVFAPIILVLFHTGVVAQLVLLARKALEFDSAIRLLEPTDKRGHPLRLEADNFFFVQGIVGPERSSVMSAFLHGMSWLTLVVLPVLILLYMQVVFLPYHDVAITAAHRVALLIDIAMLATIGTFLSRTENSLLLAFGRTLRQHPWTAIMTLMLFVLVTAFSVLVATIPGEPLDRIVNRVTGRASPTAGTNAATSAGVLGFSIPFLKPAEDGSLFHLFYRNLVVTDTDMVVDSAVQLGESTLNLRGRDLRFANLDRTDMHQADFTGADLEGASFVQADLRNVTMACADIDPLLLGRGRKKAKCTDARGANFARARMTDAKLSGADLSGANFNTTQLAGAIFSHAVMPGVDMTGADLQRADFTGGIVLHGANFLTASLQGADLTSAELIGADFTSAGLQGAILSHARLEGAKLGGADLEGADMASSKLFGADFTGARINGADLRGAVLWRTLPPEVDASGLADLVPITARAPDQLDLANLKDRIAKTESRELKADLQERLAAILNAKDGNAWAGSPEAQVWANMQVSSTAAQEGYRQRLSDSLIKLACRALWSNGAVAVGVAKRSMRPAFKGDLPIVYNRIRNADCPASRSIPAKFLTEFGNAADISRGQ